MRIGKRTLKNGKFMINYGNNWPIDILMLKLEFSNKTDTKISKNFFSSLLKQAQKSVLINQNGVISLVLLKNKEICQINKRYRNIDSPTDVISFAYNESEKFPDKYVGEIFISLEKVQENAKRIRKSFLEELKFIFAHGVLHLFGYDHGTKAEKQKMDTAMNKFLDSK